MLKTKNLIQLCQKNLLLTLPAKKQNSEVQKKISQRINTLGVPQMYGVSSFYGASTAMAISASMRWNCGVHLNTSCLNRTNLLQSSFLK